MLNLHDAAAAALSDDAACDISAAAGQGQQVVFHRPPKPRPPKPQRWSVAQIEELLALPFHGFALAGADGASPALACGPSGVVFTLISLSCFAELTSG